MATEIETTFLNIDKENLRAKLREAGAELVLPEHIMRRSVFDVREHAYARVRDEGDKVTLSYKCVNSSTLTGTEEICLTVDNYDDAILFLNRLGFEVKAYQETLREKWLLDGVEVTIDTWPWIPAFVEIEGDATEKVEVAAMKLGFDMKNARYGCVDETYRVYYDVTCADINFLPEIKFTDTPDWLEAKRRAKPIFDLAYEN